MPIISLAEYAARNGRRPKSARDMAARGAFRTAQKIGRNWVIESDEPYPDNRIKSGKYAGKRKKPEQISP